MSEGSNPSLLYPIVRVFVGFVCVLVACKDIQSHNGCRTPCSEDRQQNLAGTDTSDFRKTGAGEGSDPGRVWARSWIAQAVEILLRAWRDDSLPEEHRRMGALAQSHSNAADHGAGPDVPICRRGDGWESAGIERNAAP